MPLGAREVCSSTEMGAPRCLAFWERETTDPKPTKQTTISPAVNALASANGYSEKIVANAEAVGEVAVEK